MPRGRWYASPGGVALHRCEGRLVSGAVPPPAAPPLGRAARVPRHVFSGRGWCGCWDPAPAPQCALLRAVVARCGGSGRRSRWGVPCAAVGGGRLSSGTLPPPAARPQGGLSGSASHVLWARVWGRGGPALSRRLTCPAGGCVPLVCWEAVPAGVVFYRCEGRLVSGVVPPPATRPSRRAARVPQPLFPGRGWCGRGDPATVRQFALQRAVVARCGGGGGVFSLGGCFAPL